MFSSFKVTNETSITRVVASKGFGNILSSIFRYQARVRFPEKKIFFTPFDTNCGTGQFLWNSTILLTLTLEISLTNCYIDTITLENTIQR